MALAVELQVLLSSPFFTWYVSGHRLLQAARRRERHESDLFRGEIPGGQMGALTCMVQSAWLTKKSVSSSDLKRQSGDRRMQRTCQRESERDVTRVQAGVMICLRMDVSCLFADAVQQCLEA